MRVKDYIISNHIQRRKMSKLEIGFKILKIVIIILIGLFLGLAIFGFFGSFSNPSPKLVSFVHILGIKGQDLQGIFRHILAENIKIPFNYLSGQFSKPDKLYIDVAFQDWQKIAYKREQALARTVLITSDDDWVNAVVSDGNKKVNARIRLKGDNIIDHLGTRKWSLRINVGGDETIYGMEQFSIQRPLTRNYLNEFIYQEALRKEGVLGVRYNFVEVVINGKNNGIYALEEHFDKRLLENQERREGVIIRFDEGIWYLDILNEVNYLEKRVDLFSGDYYYPKSNVDSFQSASTLMNPELASEFYTARDLLENFREGKLKTSEVFDTNLLAKYLALNSILGGEHASLWYNIKFYYNPVTSKLEPIGFDAHITDEVQEDLKNEYLQPSTEEKKIMEFPEIFFSDNDFFEKYIEELERMSKKEYLDEFFGEIDKEINRKIRILHKDAPYYHFDRQVFYENQKYARDLLEKIKNESGEEEKVDERFFEVDKIKKTIKLVDKDWKINYSFFVPFGYTLIIEENTAIDLTNNGKIVSYSDMNLKNAKIYSSDNTGQGLVIFNSKVNLENVEFFGLERALDIIESKGELYNVKLVDNKEAINSEDSFLVIKNTEVSGSYICISARDKSIINFENGKVSSCKYGLAVYQRYGIGAAKINVVNSEFADNKEKYILEKNSELVIDNASILNSKSNVFERLYESKDNTEQP